MSGGLTCLSGWLAVILVALFRWYRTGRRWRRARSAAFPCFPVPRPYGRGANQAL